MNLNLLDIQCIYLKIGYHIYSLYFTDILVQFTTDYQWNLTDSNIQKVVTVSQSNFTDYFSEN